MTEPDVSGRLAALADQLTAAGSLSSDEWRRAFLAVRRHVFVPRFWHDDNGGAHPPSWRMIDRATEDHDTWLDAVYSDRTLPTDLTGEPDHHGVMRSQVTSSSTMPSLMIAMLELLDVEDGMQVLEIGTGAGYNAALLSERLGDTHVTSIDIDPELTALAAVRLAGHGYRPTVVCGDGADGVDAARRYDRIIATCGMDGVPPAWIDQCRDGGKILVNLRGPFDAWPLILLTVRDGVASGRFLPRTGAFMPRRHNHGKPFDYRTVFRHRRVRPVQGHSPLDPALAYTHQGWGQLAQHHLRGMSVSTGEVVGSDEGQVTHIATADGGTSWASVRHVRDGDRGHRVEQEGPRRLWDELEELHQRWTALGSPPLHRFGMTFTRDDEPRLWLDEPHTILGDPVPAEIQDADDEVSRGEVVRGVDAVRALRPRL